jgi:hypothetical protein
MQAEDNLMKVGLFTSMAKGKRKGNGKGKGKAIPLQARAGPEGSRRLRHPNCKTIGT